MAAPPVDVSDEDLFRKLLERPAPSEIIDWPGKDKQGWQVRIQVLRKQDIDEARAKVQRWWDTGSGKAQEQQGLLAREIIADRVACEILAKAVTRVKPIDGSEEHGSVQYPKVFPDADGVRRALFPDELEVLWQAYQLTQYRYGPYEETITTLEERNAWVAKLARGGNAYPLLRLPLPQLLKLTASLAAERLALSAVLGSLLSELPERWALAVESLGFGISSSTSPRAVFTDQGGLRIDWQDAPEPELPTAPRDYLDVREIAQQIVHEARLEALASYQESE